MYTTSKRSCFLKYLEFEPDTDIYWKWRRPDKYIWPPVFFNINSKNMLSQMFE